MQYLLLSFLITFFSVILILKTRLANIAMDQPNQRSLHTKLTPRIGGLAIMTGVLVTWSINFSLATAHSFYWILFPFILMLTSLVDDIYQLSAKWRLLMHLLASAIFLMLMVPHQIWWLAALLTLSITWMTNLFNFMDGSDGLAGGMGVFGFSTYAIAAYFMGDTHFAMMNGVITAACFAFLLFNFHPAKIFMGDSGSIPLGFLAGSIGVYGYFNALWPGWFPILVFSPFIMDATITLIKRLVRGEKTWQAHRSHYYQRLVQMGWGHRKTAFAEYGLMLSVSIIAILILNQTSKIISSSLLVGLIVYYIIMKRIDGNWYKYTNKLAAKGE